MLSLYIRYGVLVERCSPNRKGPFVALCACVSTQLNTIILNNTNTYWFFRWVMLKHDHPTVKSHDFPLKEYGRWAYSIYFSEDSGIQHIEKFVRGRFLPWFGVIPLRKLYNHRLMWADPISAACRRLCLHGLPKEGRRFCMERLRVLCDRIDDFLLSRATAPGLICTYSLSLLGGYVTGVCSIADKFSSVVFKVLLCVLLLCGP